MNSVERVQAVLNKKIPDRVPVFEWAIDKPVIEAICPGGTLFDVVEELDLDAVVISQTETKEWIDEDTYVDEWGVVKQDTGYSYSMVKESPIKEAKDLLKYKPPAPDASYRFDRLKEAIKRFKNKKAIIVKLRDIFSQPRDLRGFENLLMDFLINPELVNDLMEISIDYFSALAEKAAELGVDVIHTGDDIADRRGPLVSPEVFEKIIYPKFKKITENFKSTGKPYIKHTDGNLNPILDLLVNSGIDVLDPIDPSAGMDIGEIKKTYGKIIGIKGNVDCAGVLQYGTPEDVREETKMCLKVASPGGGHILSSSNSIHHGVPAENFIAMVNTVKDFGYYPIQIE